MRSLPEVKTAWSSLRSAGIPREQKKPLVLLLRDEVSRHERQAMDFAKHYHIENIYDIRRIIGEVDAWLSKK